MTTTTSNTKHSTTCARVFNKYDPTCARCIELINGAKAREGWQAKYYENKKRDEVIHIAFLKSQYCEHGAENLNPGGYCNKCGRGCDFS